MKYLKFTAASLLFCICMSTNARNNEIADNTRATNVEIDSLSKLVALHNSKTIGFAANEYATYTNKENIKALKSAQAYLQSEDILEENVLAYIKQLNEPWAQNATEMNGFYNPHFSLWYDENGNEVEEFAPLLGWEAIDNTVTDPKTGVYGASTLMSDSRFVRLQNLQYGTHAYNTAACMRFRSTVIAAEYVSRNSQYQYGTTEGYEMPLKQNSTYYIAAQYGCYLAKYTGKAIMEIKDSNGNIVGSQELMCNVAATDSTKTLSTLKLLFHTNNDILAGDKATENYTVTFRSGSLDKDFDLVISNLELFKSDSNVSINQNDGNDATSITDTKNIKADDNNIYSIDGRRVNGNSLKSGIYIKNNKKVIVK